MIKLLLILFVSQSAWATAVQNKRCQSLSRCFFSTMPMYKQNHSLLETYVGNKIGVKNYSDQGLCAPTSAAMLMKAIIDEKHSATLLSGKFLSKFHEKTWAQSVYELGSMADTNFKKGGTNTSNFYDVFKDIFSSVQGKVHKKFINEGKRLDRSDSNNARIINEIVAHKYGFLIGVSNMEKKTRPGLFGKVTWYDSLGGHALVIKGYDGDRLHIQDPWGRDYFARIKREEFRVMVIGRVTGQSVFQPITGAGWMGQTPDSQKLLLDELIGVSLW